MAAYLISKMAGNNPAAATTIVFTAPTNAANDYILVFAAFRASGTISVAGSGAFTGIGAQAATGPYQNRWFYFKVSSPETTITITKTGSAVYGLYHCYVVRDADGTTPIDVTTSITGGTAAAATLASPTPTTANANCLVIHSAVWDQANIISPPASVNTLLANQTVDLVGAMQSGVSFKSTTGALPSWNWSASNGTHGADAWSICIRNAGSGNRPMTVTDGRTVIRNYGGFESPTFAAPSSVAATINGVACSATIGTVTAGKPLNSPWINDGAVIASTASVTPATWVGVWDTSVGTLNLTSKNIVVPFGRGSTFDSGRVGAEGIIIAFADASNNYVAYQLKTQVNALAATYFVKFIRAGVTTAYASAGSLNWAAVTQIGYFYQRLSGATTLSVNINIGRIHYESAPSVMVGGNSVVPITAYWDSAFSQAGGLFVSECAFQGSGQLVDKLSWTYGDGSTATYVKHSGDSIEYPATADTDWLLGASSCTRSVKAASTDSIVLAGAIHRTIYREAFTIDAGSSLSAAYNFTGAAFLGPWDFTDAAGCTFASVLFNECYKVSLAGGTYSSLSVQNTADTVAVSVTGNGTLSGCTIDVTGTSAAYHLELGTAVTAITLTDQTFTGTPGTDKVHVLKTSGTVTITISGTTTLAAGDVTSAGATVVIVAPSPTLDATVLSGSRVVLYNDTTAAELDNTAPAGTLWSKVITSGASSGDTLTLHVFKEGYEEFSTSFIYAGIDNTLLVSQSVHASVASLRTELGITDYTTITEFALDITGAVEIDADDADGSTTKARLAIWYNGVLTTENGARYLRGAISVLSTAAIRINTSVLDLKIENISVTYGLNFTDTERRLYRDDGAAIYAAASAAGSIQNDYSGVPDTVTTSDQSLNLATAEQAIDNKLSSISSGVWTYVVTGSTTAVQMMRGFAAMLLGKVSGAGTGAETFRDIADTKDVATFMVDSSGNRTAVTRDLT